MNTTKAEVEEHTDEDGNTHIVVKGKKQQTGTGVNTEPAVEEPERKTIKLRDMIEQHLVETMTAARHEAARSSRDRGKGRPGNGSHPNLINLHRELGTDLSSRWIDQ